jgi:hypothetical protein
MADKKVVFIAFAIEDESQRNLFTGQSVHPKTPFEFVDMSVKEAYTDAWKDKVRTRIRRSDGVIALISSNSHASSGQKWEISCAKEEKKKILAVWAYTNDKASVAGLNPVVWNWKTIGDFIDGL